MVNKGSTFRFNRYCPMHVRNWENTLEILGAVYYFIQSTMCKIYNVKYNEALDVVNTPLWK